MSRTKTLVTLAVTAIVAATLVAPVQAAEDHEYVGTKRCKRCHIKQWKSWSETTMADAFESLKPGIAVEAKKSAGLDPDFDYTSVPGCVKCHVTGFGEAGGFVDIETTPELVGVGCESCHGAGGTYTQDEYMSLKNKHFLKSEVVAVGLVDTVGPEQCVGCHNAESPFLAEDQEFDFDESKERDTHEHYELKYEH